LPRKPWVYGDVDSHHIYRYSCPHTHSNNVHRSSLSGFTRGSTLAYPDRDPRIPISRSFGCTLSPVYYRRRNARPVSYYALFK
jgi:hypothetical protein